MHGRFQRFDRFRLQCLYVGVCRSFQVVLFGRRACELAGDLIVKFVVMLDFAGSASVCDGGTSLVDRTKFRRCHATYAVQPDRARSSRKVSETSLGQLEGFTRPVMPVGNVGLLPAKEP